MVLDELHPSIPLFSFLLFLSFMMPIVLLDLRDWPPVLWNGYWTLADGTTFVYVSENKDASRCLRRPMSLLTPFYLPASRHLPSVLDWNVTKSPPAVTVRFRIIQKITIDIP
jgi:hypothetical protein